MEIEHVRAIVTEQFLAEERTKKTNRGEQLQHTDEYWTVILAEEFGEVAREVMRRITKT